MVRPKSSNKVAKQKGGAAQGKRKHGGGPRGGGLSARPAKQSRREGRSKPLDNDIFEAEDSDPDEVKNAKRFDEVENYEYELPSDFEDEEIDEEMAFTEEDKKKFGAWFEKEVDADEDDDEDGGTLGVGDDDGDVWDGDDDDEEEEDEEAEEPRGAKSSRKRTAAAREQPEEEEEDGDDDSDADLFLDDDEEEDDDEDDLDGEGDEEDNDEERHLAMLRDVLEGGGKGGRAGAKRARDPNAAVLSEAYPESEFGLNPGAASAGGLGGLSIADLLAGLTGEERRKLGAARRLLEKVGGAAGGDDDGGAGGKRKSKKGGADKSGGGSSLRPVSVPLPGIVADRQERKAGYEAAAEDVTKWTSIVKANREAPTLRLVAGRDEVPRVNTTAALVAQHTPSADNALEAEVAALLEAAGAANAEALEEAEEKLALKALSLEEARERRERLAKLRSLLFYHELKSRRLKAIKSKEYHRHLAKAAKRKATKLAAAAADGAAAGDGDAEAAAARAAAIEAEFQRAKERLTQRHRNTSRWARRALKRGKLEVDPGTKAALAEQIQLGQQLKRKIEGRRGSGSEDEGDSDASTSASDGEGAGAGGRPGGRARSAALELLAGGGAAGADGEEAPKKGLLALPFMKRALERRRLAAAAEAEELLRELDEQAAAGGGAAVGGGGGFGGDGEDDGDGGMTGAGGDALERLVGYGVPAAAANGTAGRRRFGGGAAAAAAAAEEADGDDEVLGSDLDSDDAEDAEAKAERLGRKTKEAAAMDAASRKQQQRQAAAAAKKAKRGAAAPPTAAEQADLDAALAAGAAGRGLLVSSEADLLVVDGGADADADQERRRSGGAASTRGGGGSGGVLAEVAAQRGSVSAGRAGLFQGRKDGAAAAAAAANGSGGDGAAAKFVASKKFVGARPGYAFKKGPQGIGYYLDPKQPLAAALAQPAAAAGGAKGGKGAGAATAAAPPVAVAGQAKPAQQQPPNAGKGKQQQQQAGKAGEKQGAAADTGGTASDGDGDDDEAAPLMKAAPSNKDLIRQAFAGDDVAAEFAEEKAAAVAEELPDIQEPSALPGWGAWSSQQRNPKWMQAAKDRAAKQRADAAAGRRDAGMKYVVVSEKWDKKAAKYTAPAAPFPFTSPEAYERSLRQPLGRDFNPDQAFRDLTRPAVIKQAGVTINPLRFSEATAKGLGHKGRAAEAERESKKVVTVAGGMPRVGKGQVAK